MRTSYSPRTSRALAERANDSSASAEMRAAASRDFSRYHNTDRMHALAAEVEVLRGLIDEARRIRYSPDVGYVDVRHVFQALQKVNETSALQASATQ